MSISIYSKLKTSVFWRACLAALAVVAFISLPALAAGPTATNPYAWYRADIGVVYDGGTGAVSSWVDQSGNARDLGVIGTPLRNADGLIETDAGIFFLSKETEDWGTALPGTVVAVWSCDADPPGSSFVYQTQGGGFPDQHMGNEDPGDNQGSSFGDVASWTGGSIYGYNFPREEEDLLKISVASYTGVGDNSDFLTIRDMSGSLLINETGNCESGGMDGLVIGGATNLAGDTMYHNLEGVVAEVIVYESDLSPAEIAEIEAILMTRTYYEELPLTPGDANRDGMVNGADATILADNWLGTNKVWADGDFNKDTVVDDVDATLMAANWTDAGTTAAVPEPSSAILLLAVALGLFGVILRRKG